MTPSAFASCMVLNADLTSDPATLPEDLVKITTVHEFFHMIQYGLDGVNDLEDSMWRESGATYMEGVLYPNLSNAWANTPILEQENIQTGCFSSMLQNIMVDRTLCNNTGGMLHLDRRDWPLITMPYWM